MRCKKVIFQMAFLAFAVCSLLIASSQSSNKYSIFYRFQGNDQLLSIQLDSSHTVGEAIQQICRRRQIFIHPGYQIRMSSKGEILFNKQSLEDAGIGADSIVDIIILFTPAQQMLNAFTNTNLREILASNGNIDEQNFYNWHPFISIICDPFENPISFSINAGVDFKGDVDFSLFPDTIESILIFGTDFTGEIDFLHLPRDLKALVIRDSKFTANFSVMKRDHWPKKLADIDLSSNQFFSGRLDCSELPLWLIALDIGNISQLNEILFKDLPPQLQSIYLTDNILNELDLSNALPVSLQRICIQKTHINGEIRLQGIGNTSLRVSTENISKITEAAADSGVSVSSIQKNMKYFSSIIDIKFAVK